MDPENSTIENHGLQFSNSPFARVPLLFLMLVPEFGAAEANMIWKIEGPVSYLLPSGKQTVCD